jgi:hypothetical protein
MCPLLRPTALNGVEQHGRDVVIHKTAGQRHIDHHTGSVGSGVRAPSAPQLINAVGEGGSPGQRVFSFFLGTSPTIHCGWSGLLGWRKTGESGVNDTKCSGVRCRAGG